MRQSANRSCRKKAESGRRDEGERKRVELLLSPRSRLTPNGSCSFKALRTYRSIDRSLDHAITQNGLRGDE